MLEKIKSSSSGLIFLLQIAVVACIASGLIPRELYVLWALFLVGYFLWEKLDRALLFFVASLPLFMAMPLAPALDTINVWRVLVIILFFRWLFRNFQFSITNFQSIFNYQFPNRLPALLNRVSILTGLLFVLVLISIFTNDAPIVGIKRLIFFLNIFALVPVVRYLMGDEGFMPRLAKAACLSLGLILFVGYLQLAGVFVLPIDQFIGWWANHVTKTYYGGRLNEYIMLDNNWFTYEPGSIPTLRMFSIFHESHAFGLYTILALPFLGYLWRIQHSALSIQHSVRRLLFSRPFLIIFTLPLLAIVLAGTRGLWVSVAGAIGFWFFLWLKRQNGFASEARFFGAVLVLLAVLFFVGSFLGFLEQKAQSFSRGGEDIGVALNRLKSVFDLGETSNQGRLGIWKQTLPAALKHPFFGVGLGNFGAIMGNSGDLRFSAHNLYLHIAAELGIFALLAIVMLIGMIARRAWRLVIARDDDQRSKINSYPAFFLFSFSWLLVANIFDVTLFDQRVLILFAISLAVLWEIAAEDAGARSGTADDEAQATEDARAFPDESLYTG